MPLGLPGLGRQLEVERCPPFFLPHPAWPSCGVGGIVGRRVLLPVGWMGVHSRRLPPRVNSPAPWPPGRARVAPGPSGRVPRGARLRNGHHRVGEKRTVSCVRLAQDLARCGVVMGGDGLSGHPSDVGGSSPAAAAWAPSCHSCPVCRASVCLSGLLGNVPQQEVLASRTQILKEGLWAARGERGPIFGNFPGLPSSSRPPTVTATS